MVIWFGRSCLFVLCQLYECLWSEKWENNLQSLQFSAAFVCKIHFELPNHMWTQLPEKLFLFVALGPFFIFTTHECCSENNVNTILFLAWEINKKMIPEWVLKNMLVQSIIPSLPSFYLLSEPEIPVGLHCQLHSIIFLFFGLG